MAEEWLFLLLLQGIVLILIIICLRFLLLLQKHLLLLILLLVSHLLLVFFLLVIEVNFWFTRLVLSILYLEVHLILLAIRADGSHFSILLLFQMLFFLLLGAELARLFDVRIQLLVDAIILQQKLDPSNSSVTSGIELTR